jgi:hypothetical protein
MTYDEAVKALVGTIGAIQKDAPPDILYAAVNQVHKQVEALFVWNLNQRFAKEQAALADSDSVTDVDIVQ